MSVSVNETEAKYEADLDSVLPALDDLPQVAAAARAPEQLLVAVYYDTADLRLLRAGITLRRRTGGLDAGWHLKLPVGDRTREEIRLPEQAGESSTGRGSTGRGSTGRRSTGQGSTGQGAIQRGARVPRELADLVRSRSRGAALVPVATVSTRRQPTQLLDSAGLVLAEVADDRVSAHREHDPESAASWREVEVELAGGDGDLLAAVDDVMRQHGLTASARSAKLERVLSSDLPAAARERRYRAADPAHEVIRAYLAGRAEELAALDPQVRRFRPDAVHKMRVATRRLRSALRTFGTVVSGTGVSGPVLSRAGVSSTGASGPGVSSTGVSGTGADTDHLAAELKWLGDVLGRERDAEVQAAHLHAQKEQTDVAVLLGPVAARIDSYFARESATARTAVLKALNSRRYLALLDDLDAVISDPPPGPDGDVAAGPAIAEAVSRSYRATRRRMHRALAAPPGENRDAALHQARKAAKRARYAAEAAAPVAGKDARRFAGQMKELQTVLGDHQDTVIARQLERRLGLAAHLAGENAFSYGLFYERDACDARLLQELAAQIWRTASRPRHRHWLRSAA